MWYKILAPKVFNEQEIGQTLGSNLVGRVVKLPLSRLIDDITKQHIHLFLRLKEVEDGVVRTEIKGYELSRAYLARLVRRRTSRIDSIDKVKTKDGKEIVVKSMLITAHKATQRQRYLLRKRLSQYIQKVVPEYNWEAFILALAVGRFQSEIKRRLKKIYPIRHAEIRKVELC
ncbi:hypothetical protein DRN62_03860 [Nanoarchaeota archaeon]|nr:hypothetical protein [Nanoarchaeota archaeon]RLG16283.1 MAG: hypothetical protein DRN62_03860 [Nanoarchaeota archaeon]